MWLRTWSKKAAARKGRPRRAAKKAIPGLRLDRVEIQAQLANFDGTLSFDSLIFRNPFRRRSDTCSYFLIPSFPENAAR